MRPGFRKETRRLSNIPRDGLGFAGGSLLLVALLFGATLWVMGRVKQTMAANGFQALWADVLLVGVTLAPLALLWPSARSLGQARLARRALSQGDLIAARVASAEAHTWAWFTLGYAGAWVIFLLLVLFFIANNVAVGRTFFQLELIADSFGMILRAFWVNVVIFFFAGLLSLAWGLVIAVAKLLPGRPAQPIRFLATFYTDAFLSLPSIIVIYLVGFGLPLTGIGLFRNMPLEALAVLALTLTYGAYMAEVYRAGLESIHPSQWAAARSLGLSYGQTLRFVIIPQAVRRIVPPLLNNFIGMQKDTALVNVVGVIDAFNQARIIASNDFNLSAVTTVAILFILITIPQTRLVDQLVERDRARMRRG
ncbi:MAG: amino acid ABC transporter permease [Meiothermus sp.]|uniref:amino acid ABC transporter permease n=1 Tax=Meiothermus sp. TaxID=1955249 RepID=UPI00298F14C2|nr:amino acid ABC transporter permease [Meiothermus sp.]MDW8482046.1 amino acid ABC transporter permease [Meiothermus sp.]